MSTVTVFCLLISALVIINAEPDCTSLESCVNKMKEKCPCDAAFEKRTTDYVKCMDSHVTNRCPVANNICYDWEKCKSESKDCYHQFYKLESDEKQKVHSADKECNAKHE